MLTLFLVFIITKGALTLYEGNTIGSGAVRGGDTAQTTDTVPGTTDKKNFTRIRRCAAALQ